MGWLPQWGKHTGGHQRYSHSLMTPVGSADFIAVGMNVAAQLRTALELSKRSDDDDWYGAGGRNKR